MSKRYPGARVPVLEETVVLAGRERIAIVLWRAAGGLGCALSFVRRGACLVRYESDPRGRARRQLRGRTLPYELRSVEQLRYDFERDVEAARSAHGERP